MFLDEYDGSGYDVLKYINDSNYWGTADRKQEEVKSLKPTFCFLGAIPAKVYFPFNECSYAYYDRALELTTPITPQIDFGFYNSFRWISGVHPTTATSAFVYHLGTNFNLTSFNDDKFITGDDNLFKQTWYQTIMDRMNDESVTMTLGIYVSEDTFKTLMDYPNIKYKSQDWVFKGFNEFPLSAQDGGVTELTLIKKNIWN
mgnify:CR=1 FL=1